VVGGVIFLWPLVVPAGATAQLTSAGLAIKGVVASAVAHSGGAITLKVLTAGAGALGLTTASKHSAEKHVYKVENNEYKPRYTTPNASSHVGLGDVIVAANFSKKAMESAGDGVKTA